MNFNPVHQKKEDPKKELSKVNVEFGFLHFFFTLEIVRNHKNILVLMNKRSGDRLYYIIDVCYLYVNDKLKQMLNFFVHSVYCIR